jgi:hypothetical protein
MHGAGWAEGAEHARSFEFELGIAEDPRARYGVNRRYV